MCSEKEFLEIKARGFDSHIKMAKKIEKFNEEIRELSRQTEKDLRAILF